MAKSAILNDQFTLRGKIVCNIFDIYKCSDLNGTIYHFFPFFDNGIINSIQVATIAKIKCIIYYFGFQNAKWHF